MSLDNGSLPAVTGDYRGGLPEAYEPETGLKSIVVAEAAESYYYRAKDSAGLYQAVQTKLGEQRRFVLWWDGQEKNPGNRGAGKGKVRPSEIDDGLKADHFGLDRDTIHRWRKRLKDPRKFDETLEKAHERCVKVCEAKQGTSECARATNSGEPDWYTPPEYLEAARRVLGAFDLDPASSAKAQEHVKAKRFLTKADDGLSEPWRGRVWLNPPYSQPAIGEFVSKLCEEHAAGNVKAAVLLTNNSSDTAWWHEAVAAAAAVCCPRGRIRFLTGAGEAAASPLQGQSFFYFGPDRAGFKAEFSAFGPVLARL
jgi:ParB family chromosome partitioning protein